MDKKVFALLALLGLAGGVEADVYMQEGDDGVMLLTNLPQDGVKYQEVLREAEINKRKPAAKPGVVADTRAYDALIEAAAIEHEVPAALLHAVIRHESNYDPGALSPKGAAGLMQLMPDTAREMGVEDVWDPAANIQGGARYLKRLLTQFDQDISLAVAAYNAGPKAVVNNGLAIPPYPETQRYVPSVLLDYQRRQGMTP